MKNYIILLAFLSITASCFGQTKISDLHGGKHIHSTLEGNISGTWTCKNCNNSFEINIKQGSNHYQKNGLDVTFDNLLLTINKMVVQGKDVKDQFTAPIELILSGNDYKKFSGLYRDPVTKTNIILTLQQVSEHRFSLIVSYPEMDPTSDQTKGTIFPKAAEFTR